MTETTQNSKKRHVHTHKPCSIGRRMLVFTWDSIKQNIQHTSCRAHCMLTSTCHSYSQKKKKKLPKINFRPSMTQHHINSLQFTLNCVTFYVFIMYSIVLYHENTPQTVKRSLIRVQMFEVSPSSNLHAQR